MPLLAFPRTAMLVSRIVGLYFLKANWANEERSTSHRNHRHRNHQGFSNLSMEPPPDESFHGKISKKAESAALDPRKPQVASTRACSSEMS